MLMAGVAPRVIQPFPPGMSVPAAAERVFVTRVFVAVDDEVAALVRRREELIRQIAALQSRSHRRIALQARLNETTRQLLALECRR